MVGTEVGRIIMSRLDEIKQLVVKLQELAKAEWGESNYDCDCEHDPEACKCLCYMCKSGWQLTEMYEIHDWERKLIPLVTSRRPLKATTDETN